MGRKEDGVAESGEKVVQLGYGCVGEGWEGAWYCLDVNYQELS